MNKVGRNDPCPCGSGKKFKKCCENTQTTKKFHAEVLSGLQASKVSSLFNRVTPLKSTTEEPPNVVM